MNAEAEEDTNSKDDRCENEMEEECVQEERSPAPAINKDKKLRAEKVKIEDADMLIQDQKSKPGKNQTIGAVPRPHTLLNKEMANM